MVFKDSNASLEGGMGVRRENKSIWQRKGELVKGNEEVVCGCSINIATDLCPIFFSTLFA